MKAHVITGGPGVGKTTVVEILARRGYAIAPEAARMIIEEERLKDSDVLPWKNLSLFQIEVAKRQSATEQAATRRADFSRQKPHRWIRLLFAWKRRAAARNCGTRPRQVRKHFYIRTARHVYKG